MRKQILRFRLLAVPATMLAMLAIPVDDLNAAVVPPPVRALVLTDLGDPGDIVTRMQAHGWQVTPLGVLSVLGPATETYSASYDVIWIPAQSNFPGIHRLVSSGTMDAFIKQGGVLVIVDANPVGVWPDLAPGGADAEALPTGGAAPLTITKPDHPMITGTGIGGVAVTTADLDPQGTGGRGCIVNAPQEGGPVAIVSNALGPVLVEHTHGSGHVLMTALKNPTANCVENMILYVQSLLP